MLISPLFCVKSTIRRSVEVEYFNEDATALIYNSKLAFPLKRVIPMIFKGSGDCSAVDWTFLGLTIANWSFLCFSAIIALSGLLLWRRRA